VNSPIEIYVVASATSDDPDVKHFFTNVQYLLKSYQVAFERENQSLAVSYVDPFRNRGTVDRLVERFKLTEENVVVVAMESRNKVLSMREFYTKDRKFQGENILTLALVGLAQLEPKVIYWLTGHGEVDFQDVNAHDGASLAHQCLLQNNVQIRPLPHANDIPDDAVLVLTCGPQASFLPKEIRELKNYLRQRNGHFLALIPPTHDHGLDSLFYEWGIVVDDRRVFDNGPDLISADGDLLIRRLTPHPITQTLIQNNVGIVSGLIRPVRVDLGSPVDKQKRCIPILHVSDTCWAKKNYNSKEVAFDPDHDLKGTFSIAAVVEQTINTDIGVQIPGGCLVAFGCNDWMLNGKLRLLGNKWLFTNTIKWCLDREETINVPPKSIDEYSLNPTRRQFLLTLLNFLTVPLAVFFVGIVVLLYRKE
jgi:hypothetical protein